MGCCRSWFLVGCKTKSKVSTSHKLFKGDTAVIITTPPAWPSCTDPTHHHFLAGRGSSHCTKTLAASSCSRHGPGTPHQAAAPQSQQRSGQCRIPACCRRRAAQPGEPWPTPAQPAPRADLQLQPGQLSWCGWSTAGHLECAPMLV